MLHIRRLVIRLNTTDQSGRACTCNDRCRARNRIADIYARDRDRFLIRRVCTQELFERSDERLLVVDAVARTDNILAISERIPSDTESRSKVPLRCVHYVLAPGRTNWRTVVRGRARLVILRIDDDTVAIVAGTRNAISSTCNKRCLCRIPKLGHKV
ncbi:MAG: hypothetical protein JFAIHJKO_00112 [Pyrinomonadaceae bacterium]|nr:hypothetical protein [Pyrinomonadaceae bacterium]